MTDTDVSQEEADRAQMSSGSMNDLPDSAFAYIEPGGTKDSSGKTTPRSLRHFPIHDAAHVRAALSRLPQADPKVAAAARPKIEAAAKKMGIGEPAMMQKSAPPSGLELVRIHSEDYRILTRSQGLEYSDGRTVEAVITPFNVETHIHDAQGTYRESIRPTAFDRILDKVRPQAKRSNWNVRVFLNHGMTIHGTPSESGSLPIGTPMDIRADPNYLVGTYRVNIGARGDEVLELLQAGALGHSFAGRIMRSDPEPGSRGYRPGRDGSLPLVQRLELGLREFGPTPLPAYEDTGALSVRSEDAPDAPDEGSSEEVDTSPDEELASGDLLDDVERSDRPDDLHHSLVQKIQVARATRPGL